MRKGPGGMVKTGYYNCDETMGKIVKIRYTEYLPGTCGSGWVTFSIEDGAVTKID